MTLEFMILNNKIWHSIKYLFLNGLFLSLLLHVFLITPFHFRLDKTPQNIQPYLMHLGSGLQQSIVFDSKPKKPIKRPLSLTTNQLAHATEVTLSQTPYKKEIFSNKPVFEWKKNRSKITLKTTYLKTDKSTLERNESSWHRFERYKPLKYHLR